MNKSLTLQALRIEAQKMLERNPSVAPAGLDSAALLRELQLHQIQLDLQMNALSEALKQAEAAQAKFQDLFQLAPVGCLSLSVSGHIQEINRKGLDMLGTTGGLALGRPFRAFFPAESVPHVDALLRSALTEGGDVCASEPLLLRGARVLPLFVSLRMRSSMDPATQKGCLRIALTDVSAEKTAREDAVQALHKISGLGMLN